MSQSVTLSMTSSPATELEPDYALSAYDYELPSDRIAQDPVTPRDTSRLLVIESDRNLRHQHFYDLPNFLQSGDLLVFNNTKVIPARMYGHKQSGVPVEILLMEPVGNDRWLALVKPGKRLPIGSTIIFSDNVKATVEGIETVTRARELQFHIPAGADLDKIIDQLGTVPLPPYVTDSHADPERYQTIYAEIAGAIAAPTAGLHFTEELFAKLTDMGVGKSEGKFDNGQGELSDAAAVLDWIQRQNPNTNESWIVGFSFGSLICMQLLMRRPEIYRFIAICPQPNIYDFEMNKTNWY